MHIRGAAYVYAHKIEKAITPDRRCIEVLVKPMHAIGYICVIVHTY